MGIAPGNSAYCPLLERCVDRSVHSRDEGENLPANCHVLARQTDLS